MFWSRVDAVKDDIEKDRKETPSKASLSQSYQRRDDDTDEPTILEKASEYLFDLFDANCMEEYKQIEQFEENACKAFTNLDAEEYTLEQDSLHQEFLVLFENLLEKFLETERISIEEFYGEVKKHLEYNDN